MEWVLVRHFVSASQELPRVSFVSVSGGRNLEQGRGKWNVVLIVPTTALHWNHPLVLPMCLVFSFYDWHLLPSKPKVHFISDGFHLPHVQHLRLTCYELSTLPLTPLWPLPHWKSTPLLLQWRQAVSLKLKPLKLAMEIYIYITQHSGRATIDIPGW